MSTAPEDREAGSHAAACGARFLGEPAERVIVIVLLGAARRRDWLYHTLSLDREAIDQAIARLEHAGLLTTTGRTVRASVALTRLDRLNMVAV